MCIGQCLIGPHNRRRTMGLRSLKRACKKEEHPVVLKRMLAVISVATKIKKLGIKKMMAYEVTAAELQMSKTWVRDQARNFRKRGIAGMYSKPIPGRRVTYSRKIIKKAIKNIRKDGGRLTPRKLANEVARLEKKGRRMSNRHARRILHKMGMTAKKAVKVNVAMAKPHEVYGWRRMTLPQILALMEAGYVVGIEDEMTAYQDASGNGYYWSPPGETVKVPYIGDGEKFIVLGLTTAPDENGVASHCNVTDDAANTDAFIKLLKKAERMYGLLIVLTDNASWHKSKKLKAFLDERENRIIVYHLPTASAYLSLQEENWRQTKLSEFYQDYFSSIAKKKKATIHYLNTKLNPNLDLWKYLLRSPYAQRRNAKRRKNRHEKEGALQYIIRKYDGLKVPKRGKKYWPIFADPARSQQ